MSFQCQTCGYKSLKWLGRCPECGGWNVFVEVPLEEKSKSRPNRQKVQALKLKEIAYVSRQRISTGLSEFDLVLGGGIVPASIVLIGGDPGIGKSTLLTQTASFLAKEGKRVLYFSAEESAEQVKMRVERLKVSEDFYFVADTDLSLLAELCEDLRPEVIIVDSIQTVYLPELDSSPGSVSQVRECANFLLRLAKQRDIAIFLVGHITKEGLIAGPKVLEHLVDVVLYLEGERETDFRLLRAIKNRFGAVNEVGVFVMTEMGLLSQTQYEELFISGEGAVFCVIEGTRPLLMEVQALVAKSYLALPRRQAVGYDPIRLSLLSAILEKKLGLNLADRDIYIKVAGGFRVKDPSGDLAVAMALISSYLERELPKGALFLGEIGLAGEIRPVRDLTLRLKEAEKRGFSRAYIPQGSLVKEKDFQLELLSFRRLHEVIKEVFEL
ncbi:MAG: DNA repair protein RadA [Caldimicrobium sp.]|nr:DNA repair protein RadA [Caldimicrobium sp.]MCX7874509.1 DNA repair protein RadA [Caldimicrobium sp.]MDW8094534.1 DNA repair protein RadA [Caldimicrobium sp.]